MIKEIKKAYEGLAKQDEETIKSLTEEKGELDKKQKIIQIHSSVSSP